MCKIQETLFGIQNEASAKRVQKPPHGGSKKKLCSAQQVNNQYLFLDCSRHLSFDELTKVPKIKPYQVLDIPTKTIAFNEAICKSSTDFDAVVHFYIHDFQFMRLFRNPDRYVPILQKYKYVITPDMSQYIEMPEFQRYANCCWNKAMASYLQQHNVSIIMNVTWSLPDSYEYSFAGIPQNSVIAINSNGVNAHSDSKYLWYRGYSEALKRLHPSKIIRYGQKMDGEQENISVYFDNEFIGRMRHGSKR